MLLEKSKPQTPVKSCQNPCDIISGPVTTNEIKESLRESLENSDIYKCRHLLLILSPILVLHSHKFRLFFYTRLNPIFAAIILFVC